MMDDPGKMALKFLNELDSSKEKFETLLKLVEALENKNDPEMTEVRLVHNIYGFLERLRTLESNIRSYAKETGNNVPIINKLESLYEETFQDDNIFRD